MACEFICDGCGKRAPGFWAGLNWQKPMNWYQRADGDGAQIACSWECIQKISEETGKTDVVAT